MPNRSIVAACLLMIGLSTVPVVVQQPAPAPRPQELSAAVLDRLPAEWRAISADHVRATAAEQQRFLTINSGVLRQTIARLLARVPAADAFLKTQLTQDPSPAVRTTIVQVISADTRWS